MVVYRCYKCIKTPTLFYFILFYIGYKKDKYTQGPQEIKFWNFFNNHISPRYYRVLNNIEKVKYIDTINNKQYLN